MMGPQQLHEVFARAVPWTVGIEDEVMLVHPDTMELAPVAARVLERTAANEALKLEMPASQLELITQPEIRVDELGEELLSLRRAAVAAAAGEALLAAAGVHPFSDAVGELNRLPRYRQALVEYGPVAGRQLVCALQVHVAVGEADTALAVYNAARGYLPLIAALAANAPIYEGADTGLASIRPQLCTLLPRQGVPPAMSSWAELSEAYSWGQTSGRFPQPRTWWWELRPHPTYGTLEFRVPDGQSRVCDAVAVAAVIQSLVVWLAERHQAGEQLPVVASWKIAENRWSALRHGLEGTMADLQSGRAAPTADRLLELLETLAPVARRLGGAAGLRWATALVEQGGARAQRQVFLESGARELTAWLTERFLEPPEG